LVGAFAAVISPLGTIIALAALALLAGALALLLPLDSTQPAHRGQVAIRTVLAARYAISG
jgi:hypothetical protein